MNLLAIDTSSNACSVALLYEDGVSEEHVVEPREHTRILMPMIRKVLGKRTVSDLDAIVIGNGPGSFIGMRIGAAVAQGLCYGANLPIIPVSSLAAVAAEVFAGYDGERVVVVQDARMHEVYCCTYHRAKDGLPAAAMDECILPVGPLPLGDGGFLAAGAAWKRYPELPAANAHCVTDIVPVECPRARVLLTLAAAGGKPIAAETLVPAYLRSKVADEPGTS